MSKAIKKKKIVILALCCLLFLGVTVLIRQISSGNQANTAEAVSDPQNMDPAALLASLELPTTKVILPQPKVVFDLLEDKGSGDLDFTGMVEPNFEWNYDTVARQAINLGLRATDSVVLYLMNDTESVDKLSETIRKMANGLRIDTATIDKMDSLKEAIKADDPDIIDKVNDLYIAMEYALKNMGDDNLAVYISLGGWLESAHILCQKLNKQYNEKDALILAQGNVVQAYGNLLQDFISQGEDDPLILDLAQSIKEVEILVALPPRTPVPESSISKIETILKDSKLKIESKA